MKLLVIVVVITILIFGLSFGQENEYVYEPIVPYRDIAPRPVRGGRIVNGNTAMPGQFPWQVLILASTKSDPNQSICGGSLIADFWVLTAAHCVVKYDIFEIGLGSVAFMEQQHRQTTYTKIIHPAYNATNLNYDLALLKLVSVVTNDDINVVRLPSRSQAEENFPEEVAVVSGFGRLTNGTIAQYLQFTKVQVVPNDECRLVYGPEVVISSTICARGFDDKSQSTCSGDSGGPLVKEIDGTNVLVGVVSFVATSGCDIGHPSGYVRTGPFIDWISRTTGIKVIES